MTASDRGPGVWLVSVQTELSLANSYSHIRETQSLSFLTVNSSKMHQNCDQVCVRVEFQIQYFIGGKNNGVGVD